MIPIALQRYALSISVACALLAGCGGSQPPIGATASSAWIRAIAEPAIHGGSRMLRNESSDDLIYVASFPTVVLSYRTGKLVETIDAGYEGVCSDAAGNVFFVGSNSSVDEYAHGGTTPIAKLTLPGKYVSASGCASDPITGNLAVTYATEYTGGSSENVAIFPDAQGTPTVYQSGIISQFCTYDNKGNLYADGYGQQGQPAIAELPSGGISFTDYGFDQNIGGNPFALLWDGQYPVIEGVGSASVAFSRFTLAGSTATIVGTTYIGKLHRARAAWLANDVLVVPYKETTKVGLWRYPQGGEPKKVFNSKTFGLRIFNAQGLTVSATPSRRAAKP